MRRAERALTGKSRCDTRHTLDTSSYSNLLYSNFPVKNLPRRQTQQLPLELLTQERKCRVEVTPPQRHSRSKRLLFPLSRKKRYMEYATGLHAFFNCMWEVVARVSTPS